MNPLSLLQQRTAEAMQYSPLPLARANVLAHLPTQDNYLWVEYYLFNLCMGDWLTACIQSTGSHETPSPTWMAWRLV
jgi:hypothetical protein